MQRKKITILTADGSVMAEVVPRNQRSLARDADCSYVKTCRFQRRLGCAWHGTGKGAGRMPAKPRSEHRAPQSPYPPLSPRNP